MYKENLYAKMEELDAQICRCTRLGLKVVIVAKYFASFFLLKTQISIKTTLFYAPVSIKDGGKTHLSTHQSGGTLWESGYGWGESFT